MDCKCKHLAAILALVILVFSFWDVMWTNWLTSKWIIVAAAAIIFLHGVMPHCCSVGSCSTKPMKKVAKKKSRKKKRR